MDIDGTTLILIQAGSMVSTFAFLFSRGLGTRIGDLKYLSSRPGLLIKSLLSVDLLVPLIALATIAVVRPATNVALGLLLCAASPAAPTVLRNISQADGNLQYAVSLQVSLALLATITTPLTLYLLSTATGFRLDVSPLVVAVLVGISILLPIVAGMIVGRRYPMKAGGISRPLEIFSFVVFILVIILVLLSTYQLLLMLDIRSYIAIVVMTTGALAAGHLMAGGRPEEQTTLAIESATRNTGLALLIASAYTTLEKALPMLIPYIFISAFIVLIYIVYRKKSVKSARR